jgi:hypothetical protein
MMWLASAGDNPADDIARVANAGAQSPGKQTSGSVVPAAMARPVETASPEIPSPQSSPHGE